jgi:hypothetical protein
MRDHALEQTVADALATDPCVDNDAIAVECFAGGQVALRGSAASPAEATSLCGFRAFRSFAIS